MNTTNTIDITNINNSIHNFTNTSIANNIRDLSNLSRAKKRRLVIILL